MTEAQNYRGFTFDIEYIKLLAEKVGATSIKFEYKYDGERAWTADDEGVYVGYLPEWYVQGQFTRIDIGDVTDKYAKAEIKIADIPKDESGNPKSPFIMNTIGGLYIKNITVSKDVTDYTTPIEGEDFVSFIKPLNAQNSVEWDSSNNRFHLKNSVTAGDDGRAFVFDIEYIKAIISNTNAESITYEFMADGIESGIDSADRTIYTSFTSTYLSGDGNGWWGTHTGTPVASVTDTWQKMTIELANIPKDTGNNLKSPFIMNTVGGIYIKNIKVNVPQVVETLDISSSNITFTKGNDTGFEGSNGNLEYSNDENGIKLSECALYSCSKIMFNSVKTFESGLRLKIYIKTTPLQTTNDKLTLWFYNTSSSGAIGGGIDKEKVQIPVQSEWTTISVNLDNYLTSDGKLEGIAFGTFDYDGENKYTIEISKIEVVK